MTRRITCRFLLRTWTINILYLLLYLLLLCEAITIADATVLYADNFNSGTISPEWVSKAPTQWIQNGWLHTKDTDGWPRDSMAVVHDSDPNWVDYTVSITGEFVAGTPWERFCVLLRTDNFVRTSGPHSGRAYQLEFFGRPWSSRFITFSRSDQDIGSYVRLFEEDWPLTDGPMDIVVSLSGDRTRVWVDSVPVFDLVDTDPLLYGGMGVHAAWEAEARFDNLLVTTQAAPVFSKSFSPAQIVVGGISTLTFTIDNTGNGFPVSNLHFTDTLPVGVTTAGTTNASITCTSGTLTAPANGSTITYTGGTVPAGSGCSVSLDVTSSTPGNHINISSDLISNTGSSGPATNNITVVQSAPSIPDLTPLGLVLFIASLCLLGILKRARG